MSVSQNAGGLEALKPRLKQITFTIIAVMALYVLYHNERFWLDSAHPGWPHYNAFGWWLLPHSLAGLMVLALAPMQFSNRLRRQHLTLHRICGGTYVAGVLILGPVGVYMQVIDQASGGPASFVWETVIQSGLLIITTLLGLYYGLQRNLTRHRQWMVRSYAIALTFLEIRVILGVTGWDGPPMDWYVLETTVWTCTALSLLVGDIANQLYEWSSTRPRRA